MYGEKVGRYIAEEVLGLRGLGESSEGGGRERLLTLAKPKIDLPKGYALWVHKKPQKDARIREDVYLYVSSSVAKCELTAGVHPCQQIPFATGVHATR